jgi:protein-disulfide isomerase
MKKVLFALLLAALSSPALAAQARQGSRGTAARTPAAPARQQPPARPQPTPAPAASSPAKPAAPKAAFVDECGCESGPLPDVLAVVGGVRLTPADLSPETAQQVKQLHASVVEARRNELNLQINSILLEAEAKKRGVTTARLLEDEVMMKAVNPTDADAQNYFTQNRARIEAQAGRTVEFAELKNNIVAFLRQERQQERAGRFAESLRAAGDVKVLVAEPTPPATPADRARLFATVGGRRITSDDIEKALLPLVASVQEQVYELRRRDLEMKINDLLLTQEAQKRQLTARAVLEAEVTSKATAVTEAEAQKFFDQNKERINGPFEQVKYQIIQYLEEERREKLAGDFAARLRQAAGVQTFLTRPAPPVFEIGTDDQPVKGSASAVVTLVKFTDFQCPSCAAAHPVLDRVVAESGGRVRLVVRDFPLTQHEHAFKAAEAAEAAREQGKYWEYADILFRNQSALGVEQLRQYASALGLDRAKFDAALDSGKFAEQVRRDLLDGQKLGISGTPTIFVNGRRVRDTSYESLKAAVNHALGATAEK